MFLVLIVAHVAIVAALVGVLVRTSGERRTAMPGRDGAAPSSMTSDIPGAVREHAARA